MPIIPFNSVKSIIPPSAFIADNATLIGNVIIGENSSIWFGVVLRADIDKIIIGNNTNIQDNSVIHIDYEIPTIVGDEVTVGHNAILHACTIGPRCLIGMGSTILDGAVIGEGCIIAAGTVVKMNAIIPPRSLVAGIPGVIKRNVTDDEYEKIKQSAKIYVELSKKYISNR